MASAVPARKGGAVMEEEEEEEEEDDSNIPCPFRLDEYCGVIFLVR